MAQITNPILSGDQIVEEDRGASQDLQTFFDNLVITINALDIIVTELNTRFLGGAVQLDLYVIATLPDATVRRGSLVYVTDAPGGESVGYSDGVKWRKVSNDSVINP